MNFETATDLEIASFAAAHGHEFGAEVDRLSLIGALAERSTVIVRRQYGFAVLLPNHGLSFLRLLYVNPEQRNHRHGTQLVHELLKEYPDHQMTLVCEGAARERFFHRCGFVVVESLDEEWRRMQSDRQCRAEPEATL